MPERGPYCQGCSFTIALATRRRAGWRGLSSAYAAAAIGTTFPDGFVASDTAKTLIDISLHMRQAFEKPVIDGQATTIVTRDEWMALYMAQPVEQVDRADQVGHTAHRRHLQHHRTDDHSSREQDSLSSCRIAFASGSYRMPWPVASVGGTSCGFSGQVSWGHRQGRDLNPAVVSNRFGTQKRVGSFILSARAAFGEGLPIFLRTGYSFAGARDRYGCHFRF